VGAAAVLVLSLGRAAALRIGVSDYLAGSAFAASLLVLSLAIPSVRGALLQAPRPSALAMGAAVGGVLLLPGAVIHGLGPVTAPGLGAVLGPRHLPVWAALIALVSLAEEVALRGWLQPLARQAFGPAAAVIVIALVFAAIHAGTYGWIALPLDFGVGVLLGCLREFTRSVAACGVAHFVADIGRWWLP
jgi:membrane protease YdiL (CAAX protease family)